MMNTVSVVSYPQWLFGTEMEIQQLLAEATLKSFDLVV